MDKDFILSWDHGTTGIKACLFDKTGNLRSRAYASFPQIYPHASWVEHDPMKLWELTLPVAEEAQKNIGISWQDIYAIGITNQRETTILWDKETGEPVYNAIVWQCRRTEDICHQWNSDAHIKALIQNKTGLLIDPYFSGSKVHWILQNIPKAKNLAKKGQLLFGTVDTWILWKLSGNSTHATDPTNASRTLLYNIKTQSWDEELLALMDIPHSILPEVHPSNSIASTTFSQHTGGRSIPIVGALGDQQSALYGQKCWEKGESKSTYGTGTFLMTNIGNELIHSNEGLLSSIACKDDGSPCYAMEGSIFASGAILEWLQKGLGIIKSPNQADNIASQEEDTHGVYLVPAFVGLAAPHWDSKARGLICGLTQGVKKEHLIRAAFESMAYQTKEILDLMQKEAKIHIHELRIDGGVSRSHFFIRFLADTLGIPIIRNTDVDITAKGVALLAGLASKFWSGINEVKALPELTETIEPSMPEDKRQTLFDGWLKAVERCRIH